MDNIDKLRIINNDGEIVEAEVLLDFKLKGDPTQYVIYTFNEVDENGLLTISVSRVEMLDGGVARLYGIEDEETWKKVKKVMRVILNSEKEV